MPTDTRPCRSRLQAGPAPTVLRSVAHREPAVQRLIQFLSCLALPLLLAGCGGGGLEAPAAETPAEAPTATPTEVAAEPPHLFVQVSATTDKKEYEVGEPILVTRIFEDRGPAPRGTSLRMYGSDSYLVVGITTDRSSGLYDASWVEPPTPAAEIGGRVAGVVRVELSGPGEYTLEVPPAYVARSGFGSAVELPVVVVDRGDSRHLDAKAERLGKIIAEEQLDFISCWTEAQSDLCALGPAVTPHLRRWLIDADSLYLRAVSAKMIGRLKDREGIPELTRGLLDESEKVRRQCVEALRVFHAAETLDALLPMVDDPAPWVRIEAYGALATFDDERAKSALRRGLEDAHEYARLSTAEHLADLGDAAGMEVLIEALRRDACGHAFSATDALESLTGRSFGDAGMPLLLSDMDQIEESAKACDEIAAKWIRWWEDEGRARYGR